MVKMGRPDGIDTTSLCDVFIAGGPASVEQVNALRDIMPGSNVSLVYGMTEGTGYITTFRANVRRDILLAYKNPSSSGLPVPGTKYKVLTVILFVIVIRKPTSVSNKSISAVVSLIFREFHDMPGPHKTDVLVLHIPSDSSAYAVFLHNFLSPYIFIVLLILGLM